MTKEKLKSMRHPKEGARFILSLFVITPIILFLVVGTLGGVLIFVPLVLFFLWFLLRLWTARLLNNMVLVTEKSFPHLHDAIVDAKGTFAFYGKVDAYVYQDGSYNMALMPLLRRKVLLFNSELLIDVENPNEIKFLVGRFVGALASRHFRFLWLQVLLASFEKLVIFNLLLTPYQRAVQLTGDQLGLYMIEGDVESAINVMKKLVVGKDISNQVNLEGFLEQGLITRGSFFSWLARAVSSFPHTTTRVANLLRFGMQEFPDRTKAFVHEQPDSTKRIAAHSLTLGV